MRPDFVQGQAIMQLCNVSHAHIDLGLVPRASHAAAARARSGHPHSITRARLRSISDYL